MTVEIGADGSDVRNADVIEGAPAVRITGTDVRFTNVASGKLVSTHHGYAALEITGEGAEIINEASAEIRFATYNFTSILGSAGADRIDNRGLIVGRVYLGAGNDSFVQAGPGQVEVWFEGGDDTFDLASDSNYEQFVYGGDGFDRMIISTDDSVIYMSAYGFEQLDVGATGFHTRNIVDASGFEVINLETGGSFNFIDSANPDADVSLSGNSFSVAGRSAFRTVLGSAMSEYVELSDTLFAGGATMAAVDMGAANDTFAYSWNYDDQPAPLVIGTVDGGSGEDRLELMVRAGQTVDLAQFVQFEILSLGLNSSFTSNMRLLNADAFSTIHADLEGVLILADSQSPDARLVIPDKTSITIQAGSVIGSVGDPRGPSYFSQTGEGVLLINQGAILGNVLLDNLDDRYDGTAGITGGLVSGRDGDDWLSGGAGADRLDGGAGNDLLEGGEGADILDAGSGMDMLSGGAGNDLYHVYGTNDLIVEADGEGYDHVVGDSGYTLAAGVSVERLEARVTSLSVTLAGNEFGNTILGGRAHDLLVGNGGNDTLFGGSGADLLVGGVGSDVMDGGSGDDIFYVDAAGDEVAEFLGGGNDRVQSSVSYMLSLTAEVELIETPDQSSMLALDLGGSDTDNQILGNAGNNILYGFGGGDVLHGFAGADYLAGGIGADVMYGGMGDDVYYVDDAGDLIYEAAGQGNDRLASAISYALSDSSEIELVETNDVGSSDAVNLGGSNSANTIYGNAGSNILSGNGGDDVLWGLAGADYLVGGTGADIMWGGTGDDTYYVDHVEDRIYELAGEGNDRVAAEISVTLSDTAEIEVLEAVNLSATTAMNLGGSDSANTISGNAGTNILHGHGGNDTLNGYGGDDYLVGGAGADAMYGGSGSDTYYVDNSSDFVSEAVGQGTDRIATTISLELSGVSEVEVLEVVNSAGTEALVLTGSDFANTIIGNAGANVINGRGGSDALVGLGGADTFQFSTALGSGNVDRIEDFQAGEDKIALDDAIFTYFNPGSLDAATFRSGTQAMDGDDFIIYDAQTGALYYDADAYGAGAAVQFATLSSGLSLSATDFFIA